MGVAGSVSRTGSSGVSHGDLAIRKIHVRVGVRRASRFGTVNQQAAITVAVAHAQSDGKLLQDRIKIGPDCRHNQSLSLRRSSVVDRTRTIVDQSAYLVAVPLILQPLRGRSILVTHERRGVTVASHCAGSTAIDGATTWYRLLNLNIDRIHTDTRAQPEHTVRHRRGQGHCHGIRCGRISR